MKQMIEKAMDTVGMTVEVTMRDGMKLGPSPVAYFFHDDTRVEFAWADDDGRLHPNEFVRIREGDDTDEFIFDCRDGAQFKVATVWDQDDQKTLRQWADLIDAGIIQPRYPAEGITWHFSRE